MTPRPTPPAGPGRIYRLTETRDLPLEEWIGGRVKALRIERGWTQTALSQQAGFGDPSAISKIEHGSPGLTVRTLERLAGAFGVAPRELLP